MRSEYLLCASKKGMSAHQLHRMLAVTYKTAWFKAASGADGRDGPARRCSEVPVLALIERGVRRPAALRRYLSELDFGWNAREVSDSARTVAALREVEGERLRYRRRDLSLR